MTTEIRYTQAHHLRRPELDSGSMKLPLKRKQSCHGAGLHRSSMTSHRSAAKLRFTTHHKRSMLNHASITLLHINAAKQH